jgi:hypothetical protein
MVDGPRIVGTVAAAARAAVARAAAFSTLEDVVAWPAGTLVDVIAQDELTHDVVVRAADVYVCFDTT